MPLVSVTAHDWPTGSRSGPKIAPSFSWAESVSRLQSSRGGMSAMWRACAAWKCWSSTSGTRPAKRVSPKSTMRPMSNGPPWTASMSIVIWRSSTGRMGSRVSRSMPATHMQPCYILVRWLTTIFMVCGVAGCWLGLKARLFEWMLRCVRLARRIHSRGSGLNSFCYSSICCFLARIFRGVSFQLARRSGRQAGSMPHFGCGQRLRHSTARRLGTGQGCHPTKSFLDEPSEFHLVAVPAMHNSRYGHAVGQAQREAARSKWSKPRTAPKLVRL